MTRYSPPSIHVCPGCNAFFLRYRFRSVNFYGTQDWSDGKPTAFWSHEQLVRCKACAALFWVDDIETVGIMPEEPSPMSRLRRTWLRWRGDPEGELRAQEEWVEAMRTWGNAQHVDHAGFDDVVHVLSRSKDLNRGRVLWLRKRVWWHLNDRYRSRDDGSPWPGAATWPVAAERKNMEVILAMLKEEDGEAANMIEQGELLRLLGRFDEAIAVLSTVPADGNSGVRAVKIEKLARSGDTQVRQLRPPIW